MRCLIAHRVVGVAIVSALAWAISNTDSAADVLHVKDQSAGAAHAKIAEQLAAKTKLEFIETPLNDVIEYLKDFHKIEIQLDRRALDDVGVSPDTPITKTLTGVTLRSALRLMLHDLELTYLIEDEVLLITTPERADARLEIRVYNVADLVAPDARAKNPSTRLGGGMGGMGPGSMGMVGGMGGASVPTPAADAKSEAKPEAKSEAKPEAKPAKRADAAANRAGPAKPEAASGEVAESDYDSLIEAINSTVAPTTWDCVGGPGSIAPFESKGLSVLIISQTRDVHEQIEDLLTTLRKMRTQKK